MTPPLSAPTQSSVQVASPSIILFGIVPFSHRRSLKKRQNPRAPAPSSPERAHLTHGNSTSSSLLQDRRAATCTSQNGAISATPVNEPTFAKLVWGTTPRPIAQALPEIKSPFNPQMWRSCLWAHPDTDFVNDLLHDIQFGVCIGYQPVSCDYQIHTNHLSSTLSLWPARSNVNLTFMVKLDRFLPRPLRISLVHLWVRFLRSTQRLSSGV